MRDTRSAFTLVEILIVVAILGIMAAIVVPAFKGHITEAKEAAVKDNLHILRNTIERYAAQHNGVPPGYPDNDPNTNPGWEFFNSQLTIDGHYLSAIPENPFNNLNTIGMIDNDTPMRPSATGAFGWIYKPSTKNFRIDWPGTDSKGIEYYTGY